MTEHDDMRPLIIATELHDLERLSGIVTHDTTEIRYHLTFVDLVVLREVMNRIAGDRGLTDDERTFVAVPARWSLYVSSAALELLTEGELSYRIERG